MFKKVLDYAGEYRRLTYRSVAVLLLGVAMSVLPFWFAYQLILPLLGYGSLEPAGAVWRVAAIAVCGILYMCLFLEQWEDERSELRAHNSTQAAYKRWKEQTLAYYAANAVKCSEPEELDRDERIAKRTAFLEKEYGKSESNE